METIKKGARSLFTVAYARNQPRLRSGPFHLGWGFDLAVVIALLIVAVGFATA